MRILGYIVRLACLAMRLVVVGKDGGVRGERGVEITEYSINDAICAL